MTPTQKIKRARDILMSAATENKRLLAQILEFSDIVEEVLSDYEMEILSYEVALRKQIVSERYVIALLETYGVDVSIALGRRNDTILSDWEISQTCNTYRIPEKQLNKMT